jgi:hypothetical protein
LEHEEKHQIPVRSVTMSSTVPSSNFIEKYGKDDPRLGDLVKQAKGAH